LHDEFTVFCREAPPEFNDHQRDVFCVFSGHGVTRLRDYLNAEAANHPYDTEGTMYDDSLAEDDGNANGTQQWVLQQHAQHPPQAGMTLLPPPPPPLSQAPPLHQQPFTQHPQQAALPPLQIPPHPQPNDTGSPNAMSPTNDAPLTLDDDEVNFGEGSEILLPPPASS
jgi:F-box and leucine-rich repeat protein GRR1